MRQPPVTGNKNSEAMRGRRQLELPGFLKRVRLPKRLLTERSLGGNEQSGEEVISSVEDGENAGRGSGEIEHG